MSLQQVYRLTSRTSPADLQLFHEPIPTISNREVLVRIRSVALNYRDLAIASQYPFLVKDHVVPCSDAAGDIVEIGSAVTKPLAIGDRVYIAIAADAVVKIPPTSPLSYAHWAILPASGSTSWNALFGNVPLKPGQTVLFQGTGGVSLTGLMIAKAAGAVTIITSSSDEKLRIAKERYGAHHTINYKTTPNWAAEALKITSGRGVNHVFEIGGAGTIAQSLEAIAVGGVVSMIGFLAEAPREGGMPDVAMLALGKCAVVRGLQVGPIEMLSDLVNFVARAGLEPPLAREFGFGREEVLEAYEWMVSGERVGKVCINVE